MDQPGQYIHNQTEESVNMQAVAIHADDNALYSALLLDNIRDAVISTDMDLVIKSWNKGAEEIYGWTAAEAIGQNITSLVFPGEKENMCLYLQNQLRESGHVKAEAEGLTRSGNKIVTYISASALYNKEGQYCGQVSISRDISEKKRMESELKFLNLVLQQELADANSELRDVFEKVNDGVLLLNSKWQCTYANTRMAEMVRKEVADIAGKMLWDILKENGKEENLHYYREVMEQKVSRVYESYLPEPALWIEIRIYPYEEGVSVFVRDLTERKEAEMAVLRKNRFYQFISHINQMIVHARDRDSLFRDACDIAVSVGGFRLAFISLYDGQSKTLTPVQYAGDADSYLSTLVIPSSTEAAGGNGTIGTVFREDNFNICNDIDAAPRMARWKHVADKYGFRSMMSLPIRLFGKVIGIYSIGAAEKDYFDGEESRLLQEAAGDISFSLEQMENEKKRLAAEKAIVDYRYALDKSAIVAITDEKGVILQVNNNFCKTSQYTSGELSGKTYKMLKSGLHTDSFYKEIWDTITKGQYWKGEICNRAKNGSLFWVDMNIIPFLDTEGKPYQYIAISYDITGKKDSEVKLEQAHEVFEHVLKATSDFIRDWDLVENKILFNVGLYEMFGYTEEQFSESPDFGYNHIHPEDLPVFQATVQRVLQEKLQTFQLEYRFLDAHGKWLNIFERSFVIYDQSGRPLRMISACQNVTFERQESIRIAKASLETQENERNLLGRELHDNINQILVGSLMNLQMTKQMNPEKAAVLVEKSIGYIDHAIQEIRKLSHRLAPASFGELSLKEIFKGLLLTFNAESHFNVNLQVEEIDKELLDVETETHLYRICQEQLSNTVKYAGADTLWISIKRNGKDTLRMRIADNGIGFDASKPGKGIGMNNIRNRVSLMSGSFTLNTSPGQGCEMLIDIPLPAADPQ